MNWANFVKDFGYPAVVAILSAVASYYATSRLRKTEASNERVEKENNLLEKLQASLSKLESILAQLVKEPTSLGYFYLATVGSALSLINLIRQDLSSDIVISNNELRRALNETIDQAYQTIEEIRQLEEEPLNQRNRSDEVRKSKQRYFDELRLALLSSGLAITSDNNTEVVSVDPKKKISENFNKEVISVIKELVDGIDSAERDEHKVREETKQKRTLYIAQVVGVQNRIQQLLPKLVN